MRRSQRGRKEGGGNFRLISASIEKEERVEVVVKGIGKERKKKG